MSEPSIPVLSPTDLDAALAALHRGDCIGLPTETVYGLAADALNPAAVARIFQLKGRPADHPVIIHLPEAAAIRDYAVDVPPTAEALAAAFWPGPLTLILKRAPCVPAAVSGGQDTVGLRVPGHPIALQVLRAFGRGLAAPSANRFGRISPTRADHVRAEFGEAVPVVLDGGPCEVGIESTIVDLSGEQPRILRPGMIGAEAIAAVLGRLSSAAGTDAPRVSGSLEKHYAPRAPLRLVDRDQLRELPEDVAVLGCGSLPTHARGLALPADPDGYARRLYGALRQLDNERGQPLWVERPPDDPAWAAIHDRLQRAAAGSGEA